MPERPPGAFMDGWMSGVFAGGRRAPDGAEGSTRFRAKSRAKAAAAGTRAARNCRFNPSDLGFYRVNQKLAGGGAIDIIMGKLALCWSN